MNNHNIKEGKLLEKLNSIDALFHFRENILGGQQHALERIPLPLCGRGRIQFCTIVRHGDSAENFVLVVEYHNSNIHQPHQLIDEVFIEIGGSIFEKFTGHQLMILLDLYKLKWNSIDNTMFIPLPFGIASHNNTIPLFFLNWHEVRIYIKYTELGQELITNNKIKDMNINVDYYYIKKTCEQVNSQSIRNLNFKPFQNVFKDVNDSVATKYNNMQNVSRDIFNLSEGYKTCNLYMINPTQYIFFYFTDTQNNLITEKLFNSVNLSFNGHDRCSAKSYGEIVFDTKNIIGLDGVYCFIIAKGNIHGKNNGTVNMSLIDTVQMKFVMTQDTQIKDTICLNICSLSHNIIMYRDNMASNVHYGYQLCDSNKEKELEDMADIKIMNKELSSTLDECKLEFFKLKSSIEKMGDEIKLLKKEKEHKILKIEKENKINEQLDKNNNIIVNIHEDKNECPICYDQEITYVIVPCGHTLCGGCKDDLVNKNDCPVCRKKVTSFTKLFYN
jgi:hypothetical protein